MELVVVGIVQTVAFIMTFGLGIFWAIKGDFERTLGFFIVSGASLAGLITALINILKANQ